MSPQVTIARDWPFLLVYFSAFIVTTYGDCGVPGRLDFAILDSSFNGQDHFAVGTTVTYSCVPGYIRVSGTSNSITCLNNSTWSTPEMFCTLRSCGNPGDILNGQMHGDSFFFGARVNYSCDHGYVMISKKNYRDCQSDGTWSNEKPVCEAQICAPPYPITDGMYTPENEEYTYQDVVKYECNDKKLALIGESHLTCTAYGNWSFDAPKCVAVECSSPEVPNSIKLSGFSGPYNFNSAVTFECSPGFTMKGSNTVKCNASSQWDPPLPTCNAVECPRPDVANAIKLTGTSGPYHINVSVTFECSPGFTLEGASLVRCSNNGQWEPPLPTCPRSNAVAVMGNCIIFTVILLGHLLKVITSEM